MIFNKYVRTLASAALLALAVVSVTTGFAHASINVGDPGTSTSPPPRGSGTVMYKSRAQLDCERRGFTWSTVLNTCADKECDWSGTKYQGGESITTYTNGKWQVYYCDGTTGKWFPYRTASDGNTVPTPGTNAPAGPLAPQGPTAPGHTTAPSPSTNAPTGPLAPQGPIVPVTNNYWQP